MSFESLGDIEDISDVFNSNDIITKNKGNKLKYQRMKIAKEK